MRIYSWRRLPDEPHVNLVSVSYLPPVTHLDGRRHEYFTDPTDKEWDNCYLKLTRPGPRRVEWYVRVIRDWEPAEDER